MHDELFISDLIEEMILFSYVQGIYFLVKGNEIVYVGKSVNPSWRVQQHIGNIDFDEAFLLPVWGVNAEMLLEFERAFIAYFQPRLNKNSKSHPTEHQQHLVKKLLTRHPAQPNSNALKFEGEVSMAKLNNVTNADINLHISKAIAKALKEERKRVNSKIKEMELPGDMTKKSADAIRKTIRAAIASE